MKGVVFCIEFSTVLFLAVNEKPDIYILVFVNTKSINDDIYILVFLF